MVARRAHNPKVVGSNPAPATTTLAFLARRTDAIIPSFSIAIYFGISMDSVV